MGHFTDYPCLLSIGYLAGLALRKPNKIKSYSGLNFFIHQPVITVYLDTEFQFSRTITIRSKLMRFMILEGTLQ
ncbi:hypothetical protein L2E82_22182 [Cichorium intybus]|uniref:Uncharacterized protein n=1 Tax=Cichorium intybus TaxID=13427 RepID=A0ACB9DY26_CICIN|nr:hypothetical protein L2E82_22182 [Cichorium intybus]